MKIQLGFLWVYKISVCFITLGRMWWLDKEEVAPTIAAVRKQKDKATYFPIFFSLGP